MVSQGRNQTLEPHVGSEELITYDIMQAKAFRCSYPHAKYERGS